MRDGRLFPVVHRIRDYEATGLYGRIVRNEVQEFAAVCRNVFGDYEYVTYGAFVKQPVTTFLGPLVFWYCRHRLGMTDRVPEQAVFRPPLRDTLLAHILLAELAKQRKPAPGVFATTFRVLRHFSDVLNPDELYRIPTDNGRLSEESLLSDGRRRACCPHSTV